MCCIDREGEMAPARVAAVAEQTTSAASDRGSAHRGEAHGGGG